MLQGRKDSLRGPVRGLLVIAIIVGLGISGCKKTESKKQLKKHTTATAKKETKKTNNTLKKKEKADPLKESVLKLIQTVDHCDVKFFSHINPDSIDNWNPPIPLSMMQRECDYIINWTEQWPEKVIMRNSDLTSITYHTMVLADLYARLIYRSKKMSVRYKLPWKKRISSIKRQLRMMAKLIVNEKKHLTFKQEPVEGYYLKSLFRDYASPALGVALAEGFLLEKKKEAVHYYKLLFYKVLLNKLKDLDNLPKNLKVAVTNYAEVYNEVIKFFTSEDYFDRLKTDGRKLKRKLILAARKYNAAVRGMK